MTVMPDRSMAGTSLLRGRIELLMHRRVVGDDSRGLGEHLDERNEFNEPVFVHSEFGF